MSADYQQLQPREIVTKAVCGKGRKQSTATHAVTTPHKPTSILGAWLINHQFEAVRGASGIEVIGSYEANIWYSHSRNSKTEVHKETLSYIDNVPLAFVDPHHRPATVEVIGRALQEPNCIEAVIGGGGSKVLLTVERAFGVELFAETKVKIAVFPGEYDESKGYELGLSGFEDGDDEFEQLDPALLDDEY